MKKIAMQSVQMAVKLVPSSIRESLKRSEKLTMFYSQSIRRSGLTYGEPGKRVQKKLYREFVTRQNLTLEQVALRKDLPKLQVLIFGESGLQTTIANLNSLGISKIFRNVDGGKFESLPANTASYSLDPTLPVLCLNAGDTIRSQTHQMFSDTLADIECGIAYCDTDTNLVSGLPGSPHLLPDWNPEYQLSCGYIATGVYLPAKLLLEHAFESSTIAGLVAEFWLRNPKLSVAHVSAVLIQRSTDNQPSMSALADIETVVRHHSKAIPAVNAEQQINHVQWPVFNEPLVSLIIPTKNGRELVQACIESIREKTLYKNYEIILIDNGSDEPESLKYFDELKRLHNVTVVEYPGPFNYSAINNFGATHARGEIIGLINNDIEVIKPDWLTYMVGHALREDVGCVGAKLLYSDGCIQHAGVVLGYGGGAGHAHKYFPRYHPGYMKRLIATQNFSAVTAACLLVKKAKFDEVGGLNEKDLAVAFNDVDFCLRVRETGVRNVYCAEAELYHHESVSRGLDVAPEKAARFNRELDYLRTSWSDYINHDPAYSPNLTLKRENFSIKRKDEFDA